jgi:peptide chain release factor
VEVGKCADNGSFCALPSVYLTKQALLVNRPGGQKINKTNNKVMLLHKPTQLRVESQDTRSLPQNRKIARKRLQLKLDEFFNGNQSRASVAGQKAKSKKAKAKARARTRQKRKQDDKDDGEEFCV